MNRALQIAHLALLIVATALIGVATWRGFALSKAFEATISTANSALAHLNSPAGTIAETDKLLLALKSTTVHVDMAARHEDQQLGTLDAQERQVFADLHATMSATDATLASLQETAHGATTAIATTNETIAGLQPLEKAATASVGTLSAGFAATNSDLDHFITAPALKATLVNVQGITSDAHRITKDAADEADKLAHPPVKKLTFWGGVDATVMYFHSHIAPPIF